MAVAVVGAGRIGTPLIERLVAAGHEVTAYDVRPERRTAVEEAGARWSADLSAAEVVLTVVSGTPELEALVQGPFLTQLSPGTLWIDLTSASPELGRSAAQAAATAGISYLESPLGGGIDGMRSDTLTLYAGGAPDVLAAATPILRTFATTIHHTGDHGTGYLTKLLINLLWFGQAALTTEALLLARHHGVTAFHEILKGSAGDSAFAERHLPALLGGDYLPSFGLDRCVEELNAVEDAAPARLPHPITTAVAELHRAALDHFGPIDGELMGPAWLEEQAGIRLSDRR